MLSASACTKTHTHTHNFKGPSLKIFNSSYFLLTLLTVAKWSKSSPSSFFIFRRRLTTARQGPHHCWYTSTTAMRESATDCVRVCVQDRRTERRCGRLVQLSHWAQGGSRTQQISNDDASSPSHHAVTFYNSSRGAFIFIRTTALLLMKILPVKPLVARISSHCSWFVTEAWIWKDKLLSPEMIKVALKKKHKITKTQPAALPPFSCLPFVGHS